MNTLSIFPELFTYSLLAPFLIRVTVGAILLYLGWQRYQKKYSGASFVYLISTLSLILGLYTQIGVILSILLIKFDFWVDKKSSLDNNDRILMYIILSIASLSLLFTGPGFFAFDLPL